MKLLHSPFIYKQRCIFCGAEFTFDDSDICMIIGSYIKEHYFDLDEKIKKSILNNVINKEELSKVVDEFNQVYIRYEFMIFSVHCPFCESGNTIKSKDERPFAKIKEYYLCKNSKSIHKIEDFSGKASYVLHKMGLLPQDLMIL
jgi:hypothetical protein